MDTLNGASMERRPLPEEELAEYDARDPSALAEEIDRGICETAACEQCGHEGWA